MAVSQSEAEAAAAAMAETISAEDARAIAAAQVGWKAVHVLILCSPPKGAFVALRKEDTVLRPPPRRRRGDAFMNAFIQKRLS